MAFAVLTPAKNRLPETICPFILQENWPQLLPAGIPGALANYPAIPESDEAVSTLASSDETNIQQLFLDEALATQASAAASPVLEDNYRLEMPSSCLYDVSMPSFEEMLGLDHDDDNPGLAFKNTGDADIAAIDFFCSDPFQSFEELEGLPIEGDSFLPDPKKVHNLSPPEIVPAVPPEPAPSKPSPGDTSTASNLSQGGECMSVLSPNFATDSEDHDRVHRNDLGDDILASEGNRYLDENGHLIFPKLEELMNMTPKDHEEWKRACDASEK